MAWVDLREDELQLLQAALESHAHSWQLADEEHRGLGQARARAANHAEVRKEMRRARVLARRLAVVEQRRRAG